MRTKCRQSIPTLSWTDVATRLVIIAAPGESYLTHRRSYAIVNRRGGHMNTTDLTYRRGFLGRLLGAVAGAGFVGVGAAEAQNKAPAPKAASATGPDTWISEVKGTH